MDNLRSFFRISYKCHLSRPSVPFRKRIASCEVPNYKTAIVRDTFVFCSFTGLAYADVYKLTHNDIHTDERGDMWIIDNRAKTGRQFRLKLLPIAKQLVEQYKSLELPDGKVFPTKDSDSMNMSLRHVARHAGLTFNPTMHTARHVNLSLVLKTSKLQDEFSRQVTVWKRGFP